MPTTLRIAIPEPASPQFIEDAIAYNQRALPQYLHALYSAGATPIPIPLHESPERVAKILATCQGIVLPGSGADIDPQLYGQSPIPACGPADPARAAIDQLLLTDAFRLHKPILAICHGAQALNVWRGGTLIQDIPTQVPLAGKTQTDHAPGRQITEAHPIEITPNSLLAALIPKAQIDDLIPKFENHHADTRHRHPEPGERVASGNESSHPERSEGPASSEPAVPQISPLRPGPQTPHHETVNSSHHQAIATPGDNLQVTARSPQDGIIEAVELDSPTHWVVAVQWHPERTYNQSAFSRAIFAAFIQAAKAQAAQTQPTQSQATQSQSPQAQPPAKAEKSLLQA